METPQTDAQLHLISSTEAPAGADLEDSEVSEAVLEMPAETPQPKTKTGRAKKLPKLPYAQANAKNYFPKPPAWNIKVPGKFLDYWAEVWKDPQFRERLAIYVYRTWPAVDMRVLMSESEREAYDRRNKGKPARNIAKLHEEEPLTIDKIFHEFGSGGYNIKLNDSGLEGGQKTVCQTTFEQQYQLWDPDRPPLVDPRCVLWDLPVNAPYVTYLKSRGLPAGPNDQQQQEEEEDMANTQVAEAQRDTIGVLADANKELTNKVIDMAARQQQQTPTAAVPTVEQTGRVDVGDIINRNAEAMSKAHDMCMSMVEKANKPVESVREVFTLLKDFMPAPAPPSTEGASMLKELLELQRSHSTEIVGMLKDELQAERARTAAATVAAAPATVAAASVNPLDFVLEHAEKLEKLKTFLGAGGSSAAEEVAAAPKGIGGALLSGFQSMLGAVAPQLANLGMAYLTAKMAESRAREVASWNAAVTANPQAGNPIPPQSALNPPASQAQPAHVQNPEVLNPGVDNMQNPVPPDALAALRQALQFVKPTLMNYILNERPGEDFAAFCLDLLAGNQTQLDMICSQGVENIAGLLLSDPQIQETAKKDPQAFETFLSRFVNYRQIWKDQEKDDNGAA